MNQVSQIWNWCLQNPKTLGIGLVSVGTGALTAYLQIFGQSDRIVAATKILTTGIECFVAFLTFVGAFMAYVHSQRGPALTTEQQVVATAQTVKQAIEAHEASNKTPSL